MPYRLFDNLIPLAIYPEHFVLLDEASSNKIRYILSGVICYKISLGDCKLSKKYKVACDKKVIPSLASRQSVWRAMTSINAGDFPHKISSNHIHALLTNHGFQAFIGEYKTESLVFFEDADLISITSCLIKEGFMAGTEIYWINERS